MNVGISLDQSKLRRKGHPIILSIFMSKTDKAYPTLNYYAFAHEWDFNKNIPKKSHPQYNAILDLIYEINLKINGLKNSDKNKSAKQIQNLILGNYECIFTFWEERITEEELKLKNRKTEVHSGGNASIYKSNLQVWRNFKSTISYDDITYDFLTRFKRQKSGTCSVGGINTYLKTFRAVYNEAIKRGIYSPQNAVSPFKSIMDEAPKTKDKSLNMAEMRIVFENKIDHNFYLYFKICFILGGLDFIDIASVKKSNIKNNRLKFERFKGNTREVIDNYIFPEAWEIINHFSDSESDYLMPINKYAYKPYRDKYVRVIRTILKNIGITSYTDSKTPRYSFIHIGSKEIYLNRDIVKEVVGHANNDTHSIYEGRFPVKIKDEIHRKIIDSVIINEKSFEGGEYSDLA